MLKHLGLLIIILIILGLTGHDNNIINKPCPIYIYTVLGKLGKYQFFFCNALHYRVTAKSNVLQ